MAPWVAAYATNLAFGLSALTEAVLMMDEPGAM
jgi:translation elongation factor EF-1beta